VSGSPGTAIAVAGAIVVVLIAVRMLWMFTVPGLVRVASSAVGSESLVQSPRERVLIGASGMRGAISVAAALSIPLEAEGGGAFPERDLVILVAFCVVVATLVLQGVSLPGLAHLLGLTEPRSDPEGEARTQGRGRTGGAHPARRDRTRRGPGGGDRRTNPSRVRVAP
jgi:NhaP-type Na+/H+ or K+/H+ antiporter